MADSSTMRTRSSQNKRLSRQETRQPAKKSRPDTPARRHRSPPPERSPDRDAGTSDTSDFSDDSSSSACTSDTSDFSDDSLDDEQAGFPSSTMCAEWGDLAARWAVPPRPPGHRRNKGCPWHGACKVNLFCGIHDVVFCELCRHTRHKDCGAMTSLYTTPGGTSAEHEQALEQVHYELLEHLPAVDKLRKRQARNVELLKNRREENDNNSASRTRGQTSQLQELDMELRKANLNLENIDNARAALIVWIDILGESYKDGSQVSSRIKLGKELANDIKELLTRPQVDQLYTIKQKTSLNLRIEEDTKTCQILGMCQLANGGFVISDYNNKRLKQLDSEDKIVGHCTVPGFPRDVCCTGKGEVAVLLFQNTIQFVSVGDHGMVCTRSFNVAAKTCWSMAFRDNCLYLTANWKDMHICVYTLYGQLLHNIENPTRGNLIIKCPLHIAVSPVHNRIYVADRDAGLVTFGMDGKPKSILRFHEFGLAGLDVEGVCVDRSGNVFVKIWSVDVVMQVSQGGDKKIGIVLPESGLAGEGGVEPCKIHFDSVNNRLFVCGSRESDTLVVLKLSQ